MILFRLIITCMVAMPCHKLVEETLDETQFDCICGRDLIRIVIGRFATYLLVYKRIFHVSMFFAVCNTQYNMCLLNYTL